MNTRLLFLATISSILLFSCAKNNREQGINIATAVTSNDLLLDHAYDIELIPLKYGGPESIITNMVDLFLIDSSYFVIDSKPNSNLLIKKFTQSGDFVKGIDHLSYNYKLVPIQFVSTLGTHRLMALDKQNGFYILDTALNITLYKELPYKAEMIKESDGKLYFYANNRATNQQPDSLMYNFIVTDLDMNIISKFAPFTIAPYSTNITISTSNSFTKTDQLLWADAISDTIYHITADGMNPLYPINFTIPPFRKADFPEVDLSSLYAILQSDFSWGVSNIVKSGHYLFFMFREMNALRCILFDTLSLKTYTIENSSVNSAKDVIPWPRTMLNQELYGWLTESIGQIDNWANKDKNSIIVKARSYIDNNANPVLVKYKFKL